MNFHIGQKIVLINDKWSADADKYVPNRPVKGGVYTIRGFDGGQLDPDEFGVFLEEMVNPERDYLGGRQEGSFYAHRFRPVRTTSIDVFTAMLAPTPRIKEAV
mgnify:CR=1 FL=1